MDVVASTFDHAEAERLDRRWDAAEEADVAEHPSVLYMVPRLAMQQDVKRVSRVLFRVVAGLRPRGLPLWWVRAKFQAMGLPPALAEGIERHFSHHRLCRLDGGEFKAIVQLGDWTRLEAEKAS